MTEMAGKTNNPGRQIDDTDRKLLACLLANARMPITEVAKRIKLSRGATQDRLSRLERDGVIVGYTVRLQAPADADVKAWLTITLMPGADGLPIVAQLKAMPEVLQCFTVAGAFDILALITAPSLDDLLIRRDAIAALAGVNDVKTYTVLRDHRSVAP